MKVLKKQKNKKDLLVLCQFFYPEKVSSALLPYQMVDYLKKRNIDVNVMTGQTKAKGKNKLNFSVKYLNYLHFEKKSFLSKLVNYFSFTLSALIALPQMKKYKIIMVYSNPPILPIVAVIAKKIFKCKIIFVSYDVYPEIGIELGVIKKNSSIEKVMRNINKLLFKNVDKVVALSNDMKKLLLCRRQISNDKITVIENWATEDKKYISSIQNSKLNKFRREHKLIVSYFGNMGRAQDMDTILSIVKKTVSEDIGFLFAGHGIKLDEVKTISQKISSQNIQVYNYLSGRDFLEALNISDVFIVSLEKNLCGLAVPSKTYSYYQEGKPIIAIMDKETDISKELNLYNAGIVIENKSYSYASDKIKELAQDNQLLDEMKQATKKLYMDNYTKNILLEKYFLMISNLLEE